MRGGRGWGGDAHVSPIMGCVVDVLWGGPKAGSDRREEMNCEGGRRLKTTR